MTKVSALEKEISDDYDITQPEPAALVESLRAFGYSLRTSIADLVDNSISAKAKNVWIKFEWDGAKSYIVIKDDGKGMTEQELVIAMRPGSKSPLEERPPKDLGRFGLGLKTASFSQCRRLSVVSKIQDGAEAARCWDLDYINDSKEWRLLKKIEPDPLLISKEKIDVSGTIVLWEKMDRVVGNAIADDKNAYSRFLESIEIVKNHLAMVFHRYLEKPARLKMWINERPIEPWDPFLKNEEATRELPLEKHLCDNKALIVTPYVLPHQSKISPEIHRKGSGPQGWNAQQGFYVYRNERLLVGGDWLGLGFQKEEHYKLARIQIDLPNSMDGEWQIDVKKSRAKPPGYLRADLRRIAKLTREEAVQIYRHRGKVIARSASQEHVFLWQQKKKHGKYFYEINRAHPLIQQVYDESGKESVELLLRMLEETIPTAHIMITTSEEPEKMGSAFENCEFKEIRPVMQTIYEALLKSTGSQSEALARLSMMDPFYQHPEFIETFKELIQGE